MYPILVQYHIIVTAPRKLVFLFCVSLMLRRFFVTPSYIHDPRRFQLPAHSTEEETLCANEGQTITNPEVSVMTC